MTTRLIIDLTAGVQRKHVEYACKRLNPDVVEVLDGAGLSPYNGELKARASFTKSYLEVLTGSRYDGCWIITDSYVDPDHGRGTSAVKQGKLSIRRIERRGSLWGPGEPLI